MQQKAIGESRIPTDFWSGLGFSKSMPESAIRERMAQQGVKQRYESPMATTYEVTSLISMNVNEPRHEKTNVLVLDLV